MSGSVNNSKGKFTFKTLFTEAGQPASRNQLARPNTCRCTPACSCVRPPLLFSRAFLSLARRTSLLRADPPLLRDAPLSLARGPLPCGPPLSFVRRSCSLRAAPLAGALVSLAQRLSPLGAARLSGSLGRSRNVFLSVHSLCAPERSLVSPYRNFDRVIS